VVIGVLVGVTMEMHVQDILAMAMFPPCCSPHAGDEPVTRTPTFIAMRRAFVAAGRAVAGAA
jgi:hypothetical protein